ncbi:uncharacterized protein LOC132727155 isoform X2 [Ruditapes philippinarum]|uniref:uncharacterized protein LOC132727155 isoform X2 n=1 Tax=Ruditapes philippinarum TaxID=129788 RepID=UPI00295B275E|nr:uncharacterized protein LOC132727155 isoform X2 [Ruditapes philippinarum]
MYVQYSKKQSQRNVMRRIKKKNETKKCSNSVNKLKVGHQVVNNKAVNYDSMGCNQPKLIRAISVLYQKCKKKKRGCFVSSMKDDIDGLGLILQSKANKVVTERFVPGAESKSFNSTDPIKIQSQVINEQVIEADIASSPSDDAMLDPRRVCHNDVTTHNVEDTVELRDAENAGPNNNQSSQNKRSDDVIITQEDSACSPPSGIHTAIPKHAQYASKTAREASYSTWPDTSSHTPEVLADAGFFYAGFGDCVRCFYCGIGLRHWTAEDDPWIEHARWYKNCVFVKQKKGEEFVNLVQLAVQYAQDNEANPSGK